MPGLLLDMEQAVDPQPKGYEYEFSVLQQKVELDVDFSTQSLSGRTEITLMPKHRELSSIQIDARQCTILPGEVKINGIPAHFDYEDPLKELDIPEYIAWTAHQHHLQKEKIQPLINGTRGDGALQIAIPRSVHIEPFDPYSESAANSVGQRGMGASIARTSSMMNVNGLAEPLSATPTLTPRTATESVGAFKELVVTISFRITNFREGLHFVGLAEGDKRYPHAYTRHSFDSGTASCIFPCIDDPTVRCSWEIQITCSRTLGDALKKRTVERNPKHHHAARAHINGLPNGVDGVVGEEHEVPLSEEEKLLEMTVTCTGETMSEVITELDSSKKTVTFNCEPGVSAQHIGFAIGPFEQIDLSEFREEQEEEKIGQNSLPVWGYCLPGRADEVRNTCLVLAHAVDWFVLKFSTSFPYREAKFVFVDDQVRDVEHTASLSLCSSRLLYTPDMIDPEKEVVRTLAHAVATQWIGIYVIPEQANDRWLTIGLSHFMTGLFMQTSFGNNDYQFRQKTLADKLVETDVARPSIYHLGQFLGVGSFEYDFMVLKAPLVLFILHKRIIKESGTAGITRVLAKILVGAITGATQASLGTEMFRTMCEKVTKYRQTEAFWDQWVLGSGCPKFSIVQKFNKKRLHIEMKITQKQGAAFKPEALPTLSKKDFFRDFKEEFHEMYAGDVQPLFTGPMTIRIHEADGTPYEHIIEIRDGVGSFDIPYNTKYKRLKRTRRQRERLTAAGELGEAGEDTLYYCLGDILTTPAEMADWGLLDWDAEMQAKMENESYEWVRIDADFEWICAKEFLGGMPGYMYMSQLQQERDVVAQQESMLWLKSQPPHPLAATFLIRTLMDPRYFHGIRTMAAEILPTHAVSQYDWVGFHHLEKAFSELCCYPDSKMPRSNDFTDRAAYYVATSIPKAVAQVRDLGGNCPKSARQFILDQLRFNDNGGNDFSDNFKVASLLSAAAECLIPRKKDKDEVLFNDVDDDDDPDEEPIKFRQMVIDEIDRYRRMDEWVHSYNNTYTVTALDCKLKLMKAGVIPVDAVQFAKYIHDGTADAVRIKAFEALLDLGLATNGAIVTYLLNVASSDSSPYLRRQLYEQFALGLATIAFGSSPSKAIEAPVVNGDDLIVEDASNEERKDQIIRTTSVKGALEALKKEVSDFLPLKDALWKAVKSPDIGVYEQADLLDVCQILYNKVDSMVIVLKLPRYWEVEKLGKAKLKFTQTGRLRKLKKKPLVLAAPPLAAPPIAVAPIVAPPIVAPNIATAPSSAPPLRLVLPSGTSMAPPATKTNKRPHAPERTPSANPTEGPPRKIIKLNVNGQRLDKITRLPPNPSLSAGKPSNSPAPKQTSASPGISLHISARSNYSASPAPQSTPLPSLVVKARKPLPDSAPTPTAPLPRKTLVLKFNKKPRNEDSA